MTDDVPTIDLLPWWNGDPGDRATVAASVDRALQRSGLLLITGHGVPPHEPAAVRACARAFFGLPDDVKRRYAAGPDGRGWLSGLVESGLVESLSFGAETATGDPVVDARWYQPNPWPTEIHGLGSRFRDYTVRMRALAARLMELCAAGLGLPEDHFAESLHNPTWTFNVDLYPPVPVAADPAGQLRIGPRTDFGTLTLLDRPPGSGGLQVLTRDGEWVDAPLRPGALAVNVGELLARWTGDRWPSAQYRVLPPGPGTPEDDQVCLVYLYEADHDALVESLPPPVGVNHYPPVYAADYLDEKYRAITLG